MSLQTNLEQHLKTTNNPKGLLTSNHSGLMQLNLVAFTKNLEADLKAAKKAALTKPEPAIPAREQNNSATDILKLDTFGDKSLKLDQEWPSAEDMRLNVIDPTAKLNQVGYKLAKTNSFGISALRFSFTNGVSSESISTEQGNQGNFITIPVDEKRVIRKVCMKVKDDKCLYGLRFKDDKGNNLLDLSTQSEGNWEERDIPEGKELIGIRCSTQDPNGKENDAIHQLGFILRDAKPQQKP